MAYKFILPFLFFCLFQTGNIFCRTTEKVPLDSAVNNLAAQMLVFPQEKIYVQTDKPYYIAGEKIFFRAYLLDASLHHPSRLSRYIYVELIKPDADSCITRVQIRPENNIFSGYLPLPEQLQQGRYLLRAYTRAMTNLDEDMFFTRSIYAVDPRHAEEKNDDKSAPRASTAFDVSFYPEGGHIIAGRPSAVAFKALNPAGAGITITGELFDSQNNLVSRFSTCRDGMGAFYFLPRAGEHYHAVCYYKNKQLKVNLPEAENNTVSLKTWRGKDKLWISINKGEGFMLQRLYLLIHTRGEVVYAAEWDWKKEAVVISETALSSGISHVLLLTEDYQIVSERLVFAYNDDLAHAAIVPDKPVYEAREKVRVDFSLQSLLPADSMSGSFSVSVLDDRDVRPDSLLNILSTVLLTSDLKGTIHHPAYYMQKNKVAELAADILMMTHGWTRYDIPKALQGDLRYPAVLPEQSQSISGIVKSGLLSKPFAGAELVLASSDGSFLEAGKVDESGRFAYHMELPDSTVYLLKALDKENKKWGIELLVDKQDFPGINSKLLNAIPAENKKYERMHDYVRKADAKYVQENGMRQIELPEVVVKGRRQEEKYGFSYSSPMFDFRLTEEELDKMRLNSLSSLFYSLKGATYIGDTLRVQSPGDAYGKVPLILIDDMPVDMAALNTLNVHDIGQISIIRGARAAIFGIEGTYGAVEIYTKRGHLQLDQKPILNVKMLSPLGYQKPAEFYSPKYDTAEAKMNASPDLRSVIYWKPDVLIDSEGKASFEFYTADASSTYTVVIEGVTDTGRLIHLQAEQFISVK